VPHGGRNQFGGIWNALGRTRKLVKAIFEPVVERLLALEWWNYRCSMLLKASTFPMWKPNRHHKTSSAMGNWADMPHHMVRTIYGLGNINFP
jgi:hypothetical protein